MHVSVYDRLFSGVLTSRGVACSIYICGERLTSERNHFSLHHSDEQKHREQTRRFVQNSLSRSGIVPFKSLFFCFTSFFPSKQNLCAKSWGWGVIRQRFEFIKKIVISKLGTISKCGFSKRILKATLKVFEEQLNSTDKRM